MADDERQSPRSVCSDIPTEHEELPPALRHLKILIWIHSVVGPLLVLGFLASVGLKWGVAPSLGIAACGIPWLLGLHVLRTRGEALSPSDHREPRGLPAWFLTVWGLGSLMSIPSVLTSQRGFLVLLAQFFLFTVLILRRIVSARAGVPIHKGTWWAAILILGVSSLGPAALWVLLIFFHGC